MTNSLPRVAIIILNWNAWRDTVACLNSVLAIDYPNYEVVIVDNGSVDNSAEEIRKWLEAREIRCAVLRKSGPGTKVVFASGKQPPHLSKKDFALIETGKNLGYTGGNNVGIRYGLERGAGYAFVLNEDTRVSRDFLTKMVNTAEKDRAIGLVGCKLCALEDPSRVVYQGGNLSFWFGIYGSFRKGANENKRGEVDVNFIPGCAVLMKRELLESIGLLEESYFLYADDVEFTHRALKGGWRARVNLDAVIWHRQVPGRGKRSLGYYYYGTRNFLYLISKDLHGLQKASCLLFFIAGRVLLVLKWLLSGQYEHMEATWEGAVDYMRGVTGQKESALARQDERVRLGN